MKLYFNYSIDCELPARTPYTDGIEREPFFGGPTTWDTAESSVRGFVDLMNRLGLQQGTSLFVYPDVARHQRALYRELAKAGVEIALHLNGLRYSRLKGDRAKWLGAMSRAEQFEALRMARQDLEDAIGQPCLGYRACYGSANDDTFPILEELGFQWASNSSGRCRQEFYADWSGNCRYPHRANREDKRLVGDMQLVEIPVTSGIRTFFNGNPNQPLDLRAEGLPSIVGTKRERLREVIEENLLSMAQEGAAIRAIIGASHNTNPFADAASHQAQNVTWIARHVEELAVQHGLVFTPSSFIDICQLQPS